MEKIMPPLCFWDSQPLPAHTIAPLSDTVMVVVRRSAVIKRKVLLLGILTVSKGIPVFECQEVIFPVLAVTWCHMSQ